MKFIADVHLAKLAKYLRLLGLDTLYFTQIDDNELLKIAQNEGRIILTKDRALAKRSDSVYLVRSQELLKQLQEIIKHFDLDKFYPFSRCLVDNVLLESVDKKDIFIHLPPYVAKTQNSFKICPQCRRIYWPGSHYERMFSFLRGLGVEIQE